MDSLVHADLSRKIILTSVCVLTDVNGPFKFAAMYNNTSDLAPASVKLSTNEYSWNRIANVLYLDSPCGTGFSYGYRDTDYVYNDNSTIQDAQSFLTAWLKMYPAFSSSQLYLTGAFS